MIQAFYSGVVGAQQQMLRMNVQANNMANVNTGGFRAEQASFQTLLYQDVTGIDGAQLPKGSGTLMVSTTVDYSHSSVEATGRKQDYSILGDGFFALYEPATQQVSLTRDGAFTVAQFLEMDENEQPVYVSYLTDGEGRQVLGKDGYPIQVTDPEAEQPVGIFEVQPNLRENLVFPDAHPPVLLVNAIQVGTSFLQRAVLAYTHGTIPPLACT